MHVLITVQGWKNQMKNESARVVTTLYSYILDAHAVGSQVWRIIKFIQAFMGVLVTCKNEEHLFKIEETKLDFLCFSH